MFTFSRVALSECVPSYFSDSRVQSSSYIIHLSIYVSYKSHPRKRLVNTCIRNVKCEWWGRPWTEHSEGVEPNTAKNGARCTRNTHHAFGLSLLYFPLIRDRHNIRQPWLILFRTGCVTYEEI